MTALLQTAIRTAQGVSYAHPGFDGGLGRLAVRARSRVSARGARRERGAQLAPGGDSEFGENTVQMPTNRTVREKQTLADLSV